MGKMMMAQSANTRCLFYPAAQIVYNWFWENISAKTALFMPQCYQHGRNTKTLYPGWEVDCEKW